MRGRGSDRRCRWLVLCHDRSCTPSSISGNCSQHWSFLASNTHSKRAPRCCMMCRKGCKGGPRGASLSVLNIAPRYLRQVSTRSEARSLSRGDNEATRGCCCAKPPKIDSEPSRTSFKVDSRCLLLFCLFPHVQASSRCRLPSNTDGGRARWMDPQIPASL